MHDMIDKRTASLSGISALSSAMSNSSIDAVKLRSLAPRLLLAPCKNTLTGKSNRPASVSCLGTPPNSGSVPPAAHDCRLTDRLVVSS